MTRQHERASLTETSLSEADTTYYVTQNRPHDKTARESGTDRDVTVGGGDEENPGAGCRVLGDVDGVLGLAEDGREEVAVDADSQHHGGGEAGGAAVTGTQSHLQPAGHKASKATVRPTCSSRTSFGDATHATS